MYARQTDVAKHRPKGLHASARHLKGSRSSLTNADRRKNNEDEEGDKRSERDSILVGDRQNTQLAYMITREYSWLSSLCRTDPRWQIMKYFDEVAVNGRPSRVSLSRPTLFRKKANLFTVWRPTSDESIKNMMLGKGTGKGMDIKGKSARGGNISSFVPFVQICEDQHKEQVQASLKDNIVRIYYRAETDRDESRGILLAIKRDMLLDAKDAMKTLVKISMGVSVTRAKQELALTRASNNDRNLSLNMVNAYAPKFYGMDVSERLFWEAYVMKQDCSRPEGTEWHINRGSSIHYMNANFKSTRQMAQSNERRVVVYQNGLNPMEPRTLLVAYEENGTVLPVVSDFDLFLLGSRRLEYKGQISKEQVELVQWLVRNIRQLLHDQKLLGTSTNWSESWQDVVGRSSLLDGYYPETPLYGHGDPMSYNVMKHAAECLNKTGCVRHGAECFNLHYPMEMDDEFLVICDALPNNIRWLKMNVDQLQKMLIGMIDDGFTFPVNPKWILCDPGWKGIYDKLMASNNPNVQESMNCWYPPGTGIREEIDRVSAEYPYGLNKEAETMADEASGNGSGATAEERQTRRNSMSKLQVGKKRQARRSTMLEVDKILLQKIRDEYVEEMPSKGSDAGREHRDAVKEYRQSHQIGSQTAAYGGDEVEQRRRKHREQSEDDRKNKQSILSDATPSPAEKKEMLVGDASHPPRSRTASKKSASSVNRVPQTIPSWDVVDIVDVGIALAGASIVSPPTAIAPSSSLSEKIGGVSNDGTADANVTNKFNAISPPPPPPTLTRRANTFDFEAPPPILDVNAATAPDDSIVTAQFQANFGRRKRRLSSFYHSDPRWQILNCFDQIVSEESKGQELSEKAIAFTVWRDTTSTEIIKHKILGGAMKDFDFKAKPATRGNISSFIPFIYDNKHKEMAWNSLINDGQVFRVFYPSKDSQIEALEKLLLAKAHMVHNMRLLNDDYSDPAKNEMFMGHRVCDDADLRVVKVDDYAPKVYGLDISERLLWEAYVMQQDCSRPEGSEWDIGVRSCWLCFSMHANITSLRNRSDQVLSSTKAVIYQINASSPMEPRTLLMAYEEHGNVRPVVPEFDCLLFGTRGIRYEEPIVKNQLELMQWSVQNMEDILAETKVTGQVQCFIETWLDRLAADPEMAKKMFGPMTRGGYGDPQSMHIFESAIDRLEDTGCVGHGAESFNWLFPQAIDDRFLVISDTLPGNIPWKYVNVEELQDLLCAKIDEGYTFPINPTWILCDPGWKKVYDKLLESDSTNAQESINCWFPPGTGIRKEIDRISAEYPYGLGRKRHMQRVANHAAPGAMAPVDNACNL